MKFWSRGFKQKCRRKSKICESLWSYALQEESVQSVQCSNPKDYRPGFIDISSDKMLKLMQLRWAGWVLVSAIFHLSEMMDERIFWSISSCIVLQSEGYTVCKMYPGLLKLPLGGKEAEFSRL